MVDENSALAIMGNHEFNFLCYNTEISTGVYLRPHNVSNNRQVEQTLAQFKDQENELNEYLNWFRSLPLFLELEDIRIVHRVDQEHIKHIKDDVTLTNEFLIELFVTKILSCIGL